MACKYLIIQQERALDWAGFASMFRASPENVVAGLPVGIPPQPMLDPGLSGQTAPHMARNNRSVA